MRNLTIAASNVREKIYIGAHLRSWHQTSAVEFLEISVIYAKLFCRLFEFSQFLLQFCEKCGAI